jgi:hypothetical protein
MFSKYVFQVFCFVVKAVEVLTVFRRTRLRVSAMMLSVELLVSVFNLFIIVVPTFFKETPQKSRCEIRMSGWPLLLCNDLEPLSMSIVILVITQKAPPR